MAVQLRVANLPPEAEEETLRRLLSDLAGVRSVRLVSSDFPGERPTYCVVEIRERSAGEQAVRTLDGRYCRGRLLSVELVETGARSVSGGEGLRAVVRAAA